MKVYQHLLVAANLATAVVAAPQSANSTTNRNRLPQAMKGFMKSSWELVSAALAWNPTKSAPSSGNPSQQPTTIPLNFHTIFHIADIIRHNQTIRSLYEAHHRNKTWLRQEGRSMGPIWEEVQLFLFNTVGKHRGVNVTEPITRIEDVNYITVPFWLGGNRDYGMIQAQTLPDGSGFSMEYNWSIFPLAPDVPGHGSPLPILLEDLPSFLKFYYALELAQIAAKQKYGLQQFYSIELNRPHQGDDPNNCVDVHFYVVEFGGPKGVYIPAKNYPDAYKQNCTFLNTTAPNVGLLPPWLRSSE